MKADIAIIGGAGHIGLPLGILFANKGKKVVLYDKDKNNVKKKPILIDLLMRLSTETLLNLLIHHKVISYGLNDAA